MPANPTLLWNDASVSVQLARLWPALVIPVVVAVAVLAAVWLGQRRLIYFPDRAAPKPMPGASEVALGTSDGLRLTAWLVPAAGADRRLAVLLAPGNAGNRGGRVRLANALARAGLTVLLLEYRGYGANPGRPSEAGLARDVRAARAYLDETGFGPDRIIYVGESLGAAVVTELATEQPPAGLVLRSPFVDLASVGHTITGSCPCGCCCATGIRSRSNSSGSPCRPQ